MRLVIIESPYAGDVERNLRYLRACMRDCLLRGEAPFASHALYTQPGVLDDLIPGERDLGMRAGFVWGRKADCTVVYADLGISDGMRRGIEEADLQNRPVHYRRIGWTDAGQPGGMDQHGRGMEQDITWRSIVPLLEALEILGLTSLQGIDIMEARWERISAWMERARDKYVAWRSIEHHLSM